MSQTRVLDVGQCSFDHSMIASVLRSKFGADVARALTPGDALTALRTGQYDLVLINRVTDSDGSAGIDFIHSLKAAPDLHSVPVMLVSDRADAQVEAEAPGAVP